MKRRYLASTALVASAALAGCSALGIGGTSSTVEQIIAYGQAAISFVSPVLPALAIAFPAVAPFVGPAQVALAAALAALNDLSSTMTTGAAQPIVGRVATGLTGALKIAGDAIALMPAAQQPQATAILAEAQTIVALLTTFANGVQATVTPPKAASRYGGPLAVPLFVRVVR